MIKDRLKELDIKITELSNYLQISRPTMYKYIECYDSGNKKEVDKQVVKLFDYISSNELIDKVNVINFIINKSIKGFDTNNDKDYAFIEKIKELYAKDPKSDKIKFIKKITKSNEFDIAIGYLLFIEDLLKKKKLFTSEELMLKPYKDMLKIYLEEKK